MHTTSKERVVPELMFLSEHMPEVSISGHYFIFSMRHASVINSLTMENTTDSHYKCQWVITWKITDKNKNL